MWTFIQSNHWNISTAEYYFGATCPSQGCGEKGATLTCIHILQSIKVKGPYGVDAYDGLNPWMFKSSQAHQPLLALFGLEIERDIISLSENLL